MNWEGPSDDELQDHYDSSRENVYDCGEADEIDELEEIELEELDEDYDHD
jgi:YbbR domain-containing protein